MTAISWDEFGAAYSRAVDDVLRYWTPEMQAEISAHNIGWHPSRYRFDTYLRASTVRYYNAYRRVVTAPDQRLCDVGGFWGVFPLALQRLGFRVAMTEALRYYSSSFSGLFEYLASEGVEIIDYDPFEPASPLPGEFEGIFVMAVLEHYPHSLRDFMTNVLAGLAPAGRLHIEVPNIAYWPKRMSLLRGRSPLPAIGDVYASRLPFTGHHHEFTEAELRHLVQLSGLRVLAFDTYNYSSEGTLLARLRDRPVETVVLRYVPSARELLSVTCAREEKHGS